MTDNTAVEQSSPHPQKPKAVKEDVGNAIGRLLGGILNLADQEARDSDFYQQISQHPQVLNDPSHFNVMCLYPLKSALQNAIKDIKNPQADTAHEFSDLYLDYSFYKSHIEKLCTMYSGSFGCADKSRTILAKYMKYLQTGEMGEWDATSETCYWLPKFGSQEDWYSYLNGLHHFRYGNIEKFLLAYQVLMEKGAVYRYSLLEKQKTKTP